ncbi:hypothetical protein AL056_00570 [Pseudomonas amygdali pv. morsprunorum]|nr:hypothetical protein AL056_00570 [Pseudomonas amygdali pv. morsprunorum]KWS69428.1 hypothetical protein AL054_16860 [Pseudomonas amygdali pv. morsprunorum]PHX27476.1 hypothetical protein AO282_24990 [Pseudomonas amygdali pv. morsprunorum]POC91961.1 hypothetical protein BKM08_01245 [Pseudomonas amygdali pv. morsprunorum]
MRACLGGRSVMHQLKVLQLIGDRLREALDQLTDFGFVGGLTRLGKLVQQLLQVRTMKLLQLIALRGETLGHDFKRQLFSLQQAANQ